MGSVARGPTMPGFGGVVNPGLVHALGAMGIFVPNTIQADAIPLALAGRDLMVSAQTGSGKTMIFLLPILQRLSEPVSDDLLSRQDGHGLLPQALIIAPTIELVTQVVDVARELALALDPRPAVVQLPAADEVHRDMVDGTVMSSNCSRTLLVATPQKLLAELLCGSVRLDHLQLLAIDEADTVLCGCGDDRGTSCADALLSKLLGGRHGESLQMILTMAHLSEVHEAELVRRFPQAQRVSQTGVIVPTLRQCYHYYRGDRDAKLLRVLEEAAKDSWLHEGTAIIFCANDADTERLQALVSEAMPLLKPVALHGDLGADARSAVLSSFRSGESRLLVATDASARGLDFPLLRHVVLHDMPTDVVTFVHCAGRTARRGQSGLVTCLVSTEEAGNQQFDFTSHHGLPPADRLNFAAAATSEMTAAKIQHKEDDCMAVNAKVDATRTMEFDERREDPFDGKRHTLKELHALYKGRYSKAAILAYWHDHCVPQVLPRRAAAVQRPSRGRWVPVHGS